jgi:hypothetical protein
VGALDQAHGNNWTTTRKTAQGGASASTSQVTVNGYDKGEVKSALQKCIRRGDEPQALYWASELLASGMEYDFWRRIAAVTAEDVGMGDPDMPGRINALNGLARINKEWNIPFMAVMLLCRAPKNREADDAAWLYEEKRKKQGWKIPVPPEAVDGHTRRGRSRLYSQMRELGVDFDKAWAMEFYYDAALLRNPVPLVTDGIEDFYRQQLMKYYGLPFDTYDIESCKQPRLIGGSRGKADVLMKGRVDAAMADMQYHQCDSQGEVVPNVYMVKSFTSGDIWYEVNLSEETCTCPAYTSGGGAPCKHVIAMDRKINAGG